MDEERILNIILEWLCEQTRLLVKATEKADALEANLQKAREDAEYWKAAYFTAKEESYHTKIYPCDADTMGECPKRVQDCSNCKGETHDET